MECEPGTDITALLWKLLQSTQIQCSLDTSHNLYRIKRKKKTKITTTITKQKKNKNKKKRNGDIKPSTIALSSSSSFSFENLDDILLLLKSSISSQTVDTTTTATTAATTDYLDPRKKRKRKNVYHTKIQTLYKDIVKSSKTYDSIRRAIQHHLIDTPMSCEGNQYAELTKGFSNLTSFIDIRKSKKWVLYLLSDNVPRIGTIQPHFIFNRIPGWLFDAVQIASRDNKNLSLIYSTDMRGVSEWMGQLCHLINLHYMFHVNLETHNKKLNCTAIIIHLAGLLTEQKINPINRQGMSFPSSVLQSSTFENVKKQLEKVSGRDNLSNFISTTLMCIPRRTGTNSFNLVSF